MLILKKIWEIWWNECARKRTFSRIRSFINVNARTKILLDRLGWSRIFTMDSAPPCSRKLSWARGKFRSRVERVKRRRWIIISFDSVFNRRSKYWIKPRLTAFRWTWGLLKTTKNDLDEEEIVFNYLWKAAPNVKHVNNRISVWLSVEFNSCMSKSRPFKSANSIALSY